MKVPNVIGQSTAAATSLLEASGFTVQVGSSVLSPLKKGDIARVSPGVGSLLAAGYRITIYPSNGALTTVPNVVGGGGNSYQAAEAILIKAGFTTVSRGCAVTSDPSQDTFAVSTSPPAGTIAKSSMPIVVNIGQSTPCTTGDGNGGDGNGG
jgi:beta-lactam-binding protein with PASTA domain